MIERALDGKVQRQLQPGCRGGIAQAVKVLERTEFRVQGIVPAFFRPIA